MKLTDCDLKKQEEWLSAGFALPSFDRTRVKEQTAKHPTWIHFGAGNIFRAFPAAALQTLLEKGIETFWHCCSRRI